MAKNSTEPLLHASHTGVEAVESKNQLLTTVGWKIGSKTEYALEGSVFIGGAVVQWLRDGLGIIKTSRDVQTLAGQWKIQAMSISFPPSPA